MMRAFSLPALLAVFLFGTGNMFSQTPIELLDRVQKDLQTRYDAKRAMPEAAPTPPPMLDRTEEYTLQRTLDELRQARQYLLNGNEEAGLQMLSQLQTTAGASEEMRTAVDALAKQLQTERTARATAFVSTVDAACKRAADAVLKANDPKDLDATLQDLAQITDRQPGDHYSESGNSRVASKLQAAISFVNRWQDYLLARNRHNDSGVSNALRNLAENGSQPPLIPRSAILALEPQTESDSESSSRSRHTTPGRPRAQIEADAVEIVQGVNKLDDLPAALTKLVALRKEVTSQPSYSYSSESDLGVALTSLQALQKTSLELQSGVATSVNLSSSRSEANSHPDIENALLPVRVELVKLAAPRLLGAPNDEKPAAGEALDAYLHRLIESAKKRQDWDAVVRGLEIEHSLATSASTTPYVVSNDQEVLAYKNFFAGRNLEQAGQYEQAVVSYLTALRSGQEDLPAAFIGEHLTTIQKTHPAEYTSGAAYVLNPPPSPYGEFPRFGPPGMYRGGYDPRSPGRPGFPGMPPGMPAGDEKLSVPAATPSPSPVPATIRPSQGT